MTLNTDLNAELIEVFVAQIKRNVKWQFENLVNSFGQTLGGVANSRQYRVWSETVRPCCDCDSDSNYSMSDEKLSILAGRVAQEMANDVLAKVDAKVGELNGAEVVRSGSANFIISGTKNDRAVRIEQNQIINVSVKGKLFNQYPSRIYVDGKFTPASKFAAI